MANYSTNEFKNGLKVMVDNDPCSMTEVEMVKPGKGQAFNRVKFRNLKSGRVWERTFKSGESIEAADVHETSMQYLYSDGDSFNFMDLQSYDTISIDREQLDDARIAYQAAARLAPGQAELQNELGEVAYALEALM